MIMTSANANKMLKKLQDDKNYLLSQERQSHTYTASANETPVVPKYDYKEVTKAIEAIDDKVVKIKHILNIVNSTKMVDVDGESMTIDEILVRMAQMNARKAIFDNLRNIQPKMRLRSISTNAVPEYQYANYEIADVEWDYSRYDAKITAMQLALDRFNQTYEFNVDVENEIKLSPKL